MCTNVNYYKLAAGDRNYITQAEYANYYKSEGWLGRKVVALPRALWCSTVQALHHLIRLLVTKNQAYEACIAKDFKEAMGWVTLLRSDQSGLFLIQEAQFQRERYFEKRPPVPLRPVRVAPPPPPPPQEKKPVLIVANQQAYMRHQTGKGHPEDPRRVQVIEEALTQAQLMKPANTLKPRFATYSELTLCHTPSYIRRVENEVAMLPPGTVRQLSTGDVNISPDTLDAARLSAGGVLTAVDAVMRGKSNKAFCLIRPPGHHGASNIGRGFCVFNNVAIGARYVQEKFGVKRVLIVDWDAHHGDGTQAIFEKDPSVFYFSTHGIMYPGTGHAHETGVGNLCNCPIPASPSANQDIIKAFQEKLFPAMEEFQPEFIFISCGFDALHTDPLGGQLGMKPEDFATLTHIVKEIGQKYAKGRIVSCLEGGYDLNGIGAAAVAHVESLKD